jgi:hypothetical protein
MQKAARGVRLRRPQPLPKERHFFLLLLGVLALGDHTGLGFRVLLPDLPQETYAANTKDLMDAVRNFSMMPLLTRCDPRLLPVIRPVGTPWTNVVLPPPPLPMDPPRPTGPGNGYWRHWSGQRRLWPAAARAEP